MPHPRSDAEVKAGLVAAGDRRTVILIAGMKNNHCREKVAAALELVRGVREVHVNLYRVHAIVTHDAQCEMMALIEAIHGAGYGASMGAEQAGADA